MRHKKLDNLRQVDKILQAVAYNEMKKVKPVVLSQFDRTAKNTKKRSARIEQYGPSGTLRQSIESQEVHTYWPNKDTLVVVALMNEKLPPYWKTQEHGFQPGSLVWNQDFFVVGIRPQDKPSKRGDLLILRSPRRNEAASNYRVVTLFGITHEQGMEARKFWSAGYWHIRAKVIPAIHKDLKRIVRQLDRKS